MLIFFNQLIKACANELAILGTPINEEDLTEKILDELEKDYRELVLVIQARYNSISFDELHEKLLTFEASLQGKTKRSTHFPITMNPTHRTCTNWRHQNTIPTGVPILMDKQVGVHHSLLIHVSVIVVHHNVHTWAIARHATLQATQPKDVHHFK